MILRDNGSPKFEASMRAVTVCAGKGLCTYYVIRGVINYFCDSVSNIAIPAPQAVP